MKTGSYFYCRTNCPIPDRRIESVESSKQKKEPVLKSMKSKSAKKGKSKKFSKTKKKKDDITWDSFDSKSLKALGKSKKRGRNLDHNMTSGNFFGNQSGIQLFLEV